MSLDPVSAIADAVNTVLGPIVANLFPNKAAIEQQQIANQLATTLANNDLIKAQLTVNQAEASSSSMFVAGWRPFIGWVLGSALAYQFVIMPIGLYISLLLGYVPSTKPPALDSNLWNLLSVMLGSAGMIGYRTYEKVKGVDTKTIRN